MLRSDLEPGKYGIWKEKRKNLGITRNLTNDTSHHSRRIRSWDCRRPVCCIRDKSRSGFPIRHESGPKQTTKACLAIQEVFVRNGEREGGLQPHHVGTDGLGYHTAHWRLHGRGGRQRGWSREQRGGGSSWWEGGGSWWQDGDHGGQHGWRLGHPRLVPGAGFAHRRPGRGRPDV